MAGKSRQRGMSMFTLILLLALLGGIGAIALKALPSLMEYQSVIKAVNKASRDGTTVMDVRNSFDRAAQIDNITSISGKDLEVKKEGDQVVVGFDYQKEFHIFGPAWLTMKYQGESRPGR